MRQIKGSQDCCPYDDYVCADDDLPICRDMDNMNWQEEFFDELGPCPKLPAESGDANSDCDDDQDSASYDELPSSKITSYREAFSSLEDVSSFLHSPYLNMFSE